MGSRLGKAVQGREGIRKPVDVWGTRKKFVWPEPEMKGSQGDRVRRAGPLPGTFLGSPRRASSWEGQRQLWVWKSSGAVPGRQGRKLQSRERVRPELGPEASQSGGWSREGWGAGGWHLGTSGRMGKGKDSQCLGSGWTVKVSQGSR